MGWALDRVRLPLQWGTFGLILLVVCGDAWRQLADGLHLIDFEQLKIENLTLNEKIEERTEELHKLSKKTTQTVQVLTHVKEKLQFVQAEAQVRGCGSAGVRCPCNAIAGLRPFVTATHPKGCTTASVLLLCCP
jgi:hypothetical protein